MGCLAKCYDSNHVFKTIHESVAGIPYKNMLLKSQRLFCTIISLSIYIYEHEFSPASPAHLMHHYEFKETLFFLLFLPGFGN